MPSLPPATGAPPTQSLDGGGEAPPLYDPLVVDIDGNPAPWLGGEIEVRRPVNGLPVASIEVQSKNGWLVNVGTENYQDLRPLGEVLNDGQLITIRTSREDPASDYVLWEGYFAGPRYRGDAGGMSVGAEFEYIAADLRDDLDRTFCGRIMRTFKNIDTPRLGLCQARECIFNPDGAANCARLCETVTLSEGDTLPVPYFTTPADATRQCWTWARVLLYWCYWARRAEESPGIDATTLPGWTIGPSHAQRDVLLLPCALRAGTWKSIVDYIVAEELHLVDPDTVSSAPEDPWRAALIAKPRSHAIEGMNLLKALDWTCARAGMGYVWETGTATEGRATHGLRFFVAGGSPLKEFAQASPEFTTQDKEWSDVRAKADVTAVQLFGDHRSVLNKVRVIGAPVKYEITVELVPGWVSNADWDVDPQDAAAVAAAIAKLSGQTWIDKYVVDGLNFGLPANRFIGRLWGLNTTGLWSAYGRTVLHHSFPAAKYGRTFGDGKRYYDFSECRWGECFSSGPIEDPSSYAPGKHFHRRRKFEACVTGISPTSPLAPWVQVSFDSGATWHGLTGGAEISEQDARLCFAVKDLSKEPLEPLTGKSFAECYIRGTLRVRITAGITGDYCLDSGLMGTNFSLSRRARGQLSLRRSDAKIVLRENLTWPGGGTFSGGNSQFKGSTHVSLARCDQAAEQEAAATRLIAGDRVRWRGFVERPELVFPTPEIAEFAVRPGDEVIGLLAEGAQQDRYSLRLPANQKEAFALCGACEWKFKLGGGTQGAPAYCTRYSLEHNEPVIEGRQYSAGGAWVAPGGRAATWISRRRGAEVER